MRLITPVSFGWPADIAERQTVLQSKVLECQPDMEAAGSEGQLASEVAASLRPAAVAELDKTLSKLFASSSEVDSFEPVSLAMHRPCVVQV